MLDYLTEMEYCFFVVFDPIGHVILTLNDIQMKQYHDYLLTVILHKLYGGAMYYFDILACKKGKIDFILPVLQHYGCLCDEALKNLQN